MVLSSSKQDALQAFIRGILDQEGESTAVQQFSRWHSQPHTGGPGRTPSYRSLIPLTRPAAGEQFAFEVDLDACSGCKACVTACHSLNGLEEDESWRSVGLLTSRDRSPHALAGLQHVTTACHHCVEPACMHGCPVLAYDKAPDTGIVRHLDDQCIGCTYCVMMCPYEVPRYSSRLGIVRKCDMCQGRLAAGEAPACAQACPSAAIRITITPVAPIRAAHSSQPTRAPAESDRERNGFLPASPDPAITLPTTRYLSSRDELPSLVAADQDDAPRAAMHLPLVVMLVLTQAAAGAATFIPFVPPAAAPRISVAAAALVGAGLAASVLHLGRPLRAWRSFLGWRRSWLSREAMLLGGFAGLVMTGAVAENVPLPAIPSAWKIALHATSAVTGLAAVFSSVMVYVATRRPEWNLSQGVSRFFGAAFTLGPATLVALPLVHSLPPFVLAAIATAGLAVSGLAESRVFRISPTAAPGSASRRHRLATGPLRTMWVSRAILGTLGLVLLWAAALTASPSTTSAVAVTAALTLAAGALVERALFFAGSSPDRMPGGIAP